ncbi:MAG: phage holin family protein [Ferruginibacter sp.]
MKTIYLFATQFFALLKNNAVVCLNVIGVFLLPIVPLLLLTGLMILFDTGTGLYRSHKLKEAITSRKFSQVVSKLLLYNFGIITVYIIDVFLLGEFFKLLISIPFLCTKITALILVSIEFLSINENIKQISGVSLIQEFKKLVTRAKVLKSSVEDLTNIKTPSNENPTTENQ